MLQRLRSKLTFANVASAIALWVSLSTGVAYAAATIMSSDIVDGEVKTQDLNGGAVTSPKIANGGVKNGDLEDGAITSAKVLDDTVVGGALSATDLQANSVDQSEIATDAVNATEIANDSIDSGEIVDFSLTNQDISVFFAEVNSDGTLANSSGSVTSIKLAATGQYEVDFGRDVTLCAAVVTVGTNSGTNTVIGEANVADRSGNAEAVFVDTNTSAGSASDLPFRMVVVC